MGLAVNSSFSVLKAFMLSNQAESFINTSLDVQIASACAAQLNLDDKNALVIYFCGN